MTTRAIVVVLVVAGAFAALVTSSPGDGSGRGKPGAAARPSRGAVSMLAFSAQPREGGPVQVFVLRDDGTARQLTQGSRDVEVQGWSAVGSRLIGRSTEGRRHLLVAIDPQTGFTQTLWRGRSPIGDIVTGPMGDVLVFSTGRRLMMLRGRTSKPVRLSSRYAVGKSADGVSTPSASFGDGGVVFSMAWGSATRLAVGQPDGRVVALPTGIPHRCTRNGVPDCPHDTQPAWQWGEERGRIVYVRRRGNRSSLRWIRGPHWGTYRLSEAVRQGLGAPTWSPDGTRLAFTSDSGLYAMNAHGGSLQRVAAIRPAGVPSWSPDGSQIAYATGTSFSGSPETLAIRALDGSSALHVPLSTLYGAIVGPFVWQPTYTSG